MSKLSRNSNPDDIVRTTRTFFVTTKTAMGKRLLQTERNANLLIDVLRTNVAAKKVRVHDFVIMPDHVHLLLSINEEMSVEKAVQSTREFRETSRIYTAESKGGFSYRLKKDFGFDGAVWQRGFADDRIKKAAGAKAQELEALSGTTEVVPFHEAGGSQTEVVPFHEAAGSESEGLSTHESGSTSSHD